jgi:hypothetical protein
VAVRSSGIVVDDHGTRRPAVHIDVGGRCDIVDLPRVVLMDGVGDLATAATPVDASQLDLVVAMSHPVTCRIVMRLDIDEHGEALHTAASSGELVITMDGASPGSHALVLDIDCASLAGVLAAMGAAPS